MASSSTLTETKEIAPYIPGCIRTKMKPCDRRDLEIDDGETGIADQDGLDEQVPFRDWMRVGMV
jgi:hypothetical protein